MSTKIVITVDCEDPSDAQWLESRAEAAVREVVTVADEEKRLDGDVEVFSERDDG